MTDAAAKSYDRCAQGAGFAKFNPFLDSRPSCRQRQATAWSLLRWILRGELIAASEAYADMAIRWGVWPNTRLQNTTYWVCSDGCSVRLTHSRSSSSFVRCSLQYGGNIYRRGVLLQPVAPPEFRNIKVPMPHHAAWRDFAHICICKVVDQVIAV